MQDIKKLQFDFLALAFSVVIFLPLAFSGIILSNGGIEIYFIGCVCTIKTRMNQKIPKSREK